MRTRVAALGTALLLVVPAAGCSTSPADREATNGDSPTATATPAPAGTSREAGTPTATPEPAPRREPGTVPPSWLGERLLPVTDTGYAAPHRTPRALRERRFTLPDRLPMLPGRGFAARVSVPPPDDVLDRSSWAPACPVPKDELAWVRLTFWGFDDARHTGEIMVNARVADDVVGVFRELYRSRFPLEQMVVAGRYVPGQPSSGDGNGTGGFVCRPVTGGTSYSQHAYGLAIDVNTFQNPYQRGEVVLPERARAYLDREWVRPGMILPGGPVVRAFAAVGWEWGGAWRTLKDYQHFSESGR